MVYCHKTTPKRSSKDENEIAKSIVDQIIAETEAVNDEAPAKNEAAVSLGRLGGLKGGKARAAALTPERRKEISKQAAAARWSKNKRSIQRNGAFPFLPQFD